MVAFEIITIGVGVAGSALCASAWFRPKATLSELGHQGGMWFDHAEDQQLADRPPEDAVDAPIPFRPLRSRLR